MRRYLKRYWSEPPDAQRASWGGATYYFEIDERFYPLRQIEVYDSGPVLKYGPRNVADSDGMLSDQPLDAAEFADCEISSGEFEALWNADNRGGGRASAEGRI